MATVADFIDFTFDVPAWFGMFAVIALAVFAFMVWMLVDAIRRPEEEFPSPGSKTGWTVALAVGLVLNVLGFAIAIAYFIIVYRAAPVRAREALTTAAGTASAPPMPSPPIIATNCRSCGVKLAAGARFCHSCGTPVQSEGT